MRAEPYSRARCVARRKGLHTGGACKHTLRRPYRPPSGAAEGACGLAEIQPSAGDAAAVACMRTGATDADPICPGGTAGLPCEQACSALSKIPEATPPSIRGRVCATPKGVAMTVGAADAAPTRSCANDSLLCEKVELAAAPSASRAELADCAAAAPASMSPP